MTDIGRGGAADEDRLPWLEPVEDEDAGSGVGAGKLIAAVILALVAIGLVVGGIFWLRDRSAPGPDGHGDLIVPPEGAYKTRPDEPGGMTVEGQGDTAFGASEGQSTSATIDLSALPETPVKEAGQVTRADAAAVKPGPAPKTAPTTPPAEKAPAAKPAEKMAAAPAPKAAPHAPAAGGTVQLGAFSSEAKANAAWKSLSGRYAYLAPLTKLVQPVQSGGTTLYRLRVVAGSQASTICGKLKVAGETCAAVN